MCGRYTLIHALGRDLAAELGATGDGALRIPFAPDEAWPGPRYNIAPTQHAPVVRLVDGTFQVDLLRWGLLPRWAIGRKTAPLINARGDTIAEKPAFKNAFRHRRALVPADGFYEWRKPAAGAPRGAKPQPYLFRRPDEGLMMFAAIWEPPNEAAPAGSYGIITTAPHPAVEAYHDRSPVVLPREAYRAWLDPDRDDPAELVPLLHTGGELTVRAVSQRINSTHVADEASLIDPVDPEADQPTGPAAKPRR